MPPLEDPADDMDRDVGLNVPGVMSASEWGRIIELTGAGTERRDGPSCCHERGESTNRSVEEMV
jgi:hypothetical protein